MRKKTPIATPVECLADQHQSLPAAKFYSDRKAIKGMFGTQIPDAVHLEIL